MVSGLPMLLGFVTKYREFATGKGLSRKRFAEEEKARHSATISGGIPTGRTKCVLPEGVSEWKGKKKVGGDDNNV